MKYICEALKVSKNVKRKLRYGTKALSEYCHNNPASLARCGHVSVAHYIPGIFVFCDGKTPPSFAKITAILTVDIRNFIYHISQEINRQPEHLRRYFSQQGFTSSWKKKTVISVIVLKHIEKHANQSNSPALQNTFRGRFFFKVSSVYGVDNTIYVE